jgi:hypothetical protein
MSDPLHRPGPVFQYIYPIRKDFRRERVVIQEDRPMPFGYFSLTLEWIELALKAARKAKRNSSFHEYEDPSFEADYYRRSSKVMVEFISAGGPCILLLNTCPIAQVDIKGDIALAEHFEVPAMTKEEWQIWNSIGASTTHFEIEENPSREIELIQVKVEEGILNALELRRSINLTTGQTQTDVVCQRCKLPKKPTLDNLADWLEVRKGTAHPHVLELYPN